MIKFAKNKDFIRPTYAKISLKNFLYNYKLLNSHIKPETKVVAVVKANAYGHGIVEIAKTLQDKTDVALLGVATLEEGIKLRENGIKKDILVLGSIYPFSSFYYIHKYNLIPTIASYYIAKKLSLYCRKNNQKIKVHLKVDTGMGRIGMSVSKAEYFINKICKLEHIEVEGVYTHIANAGSDRKATLKQLNDFKNIKNSISNLNIKYFHAANTETVLEYKDSEFNMIRVGLALYGLYQSKLFAKFKPVMQLKSKVVFLKVVPAKTPISYGSTFITNKKTLVATVAIGYADGYKRSFSNKVNGIIKGQKVKQIGTICMDMCMFDVTNIKNIKIGDDIALIGGSEENFVSFNELADIADTITYELVTQITQRVPRVYEI